MKRLYAFFSALLAVLFVATSPAFAVRAAITAVSPKSVDTGTISANAADVALTAADASNLNEFTASGKDLILVYNSGAGARTVTITSVADDLGRTGDVTTYSLGAGEYALFGPVQFKGWRQTNGKVYLEGSHAEIKFLIIKCP